LWLGPFTFRVNLAVHPENESDSSSFTLALCMNVEVKTYLVTELQ
jgi:hypothetical protein